MTEGQKKIIVSIASALLTIYPSLGLIGWLVSPHVNGYIKEQARQEIWGEIAGRLGKDDNGERYTVETAIEAVEWQLKNGHTRDILFKSMSDSLQQYEKYLRFAHKATPEGVLWINGRAWWYTGERDQYGEPEKYRVHSDLMTGYRYWIDDQGVHHYIWSKY